MEHDVSTGRRATGRPAPARDAGPAPRIHEGYEADAVLRGLNAPGAAVGRDILLASGLDAMARAAVLAHEATHVRQAGGREVSGAPVVGPPDPTLEREAGIAAAIGAPLASRRTRADPARVRLYDENQLLGGSISQGWADALSADELASALDAIDAQIEMLPEDSILRTAALDNRAVLEGTALRRNLGEALSPPVPVALHLDDERPWIVRVDDAEASPRDIANELYGVDISPIMPREGDLLAAGANAIAGMAGIDLGLPTEGDLTVIEELLVPEYLEEFHGKMEALLETDLARSKKLLLYDLPDKEDIDELEDISRRWSQRGNYRARGGGSYFDAYLGALDSATLVTNWGVTTMNRRSYLDELYAVLGNPAYDRAAALNARVSRSSEVYGAYAPTWRLQEQGALPAGEGVAAAPNEKLVRRSANLVLSRMEGLTLPTTSAAIVEIMEGLPPAAQVAVLQKVMAAHEDTIAWGLLGRFGEPTGRHMLFRLFESLEDDDKKRLGDALQRDGILTEDAAATLIEGRTWAGRNLPWTTYHGEQAAQWWQERYEQGGSWLNLVGAGFAGLWTPETASGTILTLVGARVGLPLVSRAPAGVQAFLLGFGATTGAIAATDALMDASTGETKDGKPLNEGQRVTRLLQGLMEIAFLAETVRVARKLDTPGGGLAPGGDELPALRPGGAAGGAPQLGAGAAAGETALTAGIATSGGGGGVRILRADPDGRVLALARSAQGEHAYIDIDMKSGNGTIVFPERGVYPVEGFQIGPPRKALPAPAGPDADIDAMIARLEASETGGIVAGEGFSDLHLYSQSSQARATVNAQGGPTVTGRPGRTPPGVAVNPNPGHQGAHLTPQSTVRNLPNVDPDDLFVRLLPTGRGHAHTVFDQHWQAAFRQIRQTTGRTTTTAREVYEVVTDALRNSGAFTPSEAEAYRLLLSEELFNRLGLLPTDPMRMPGT